MPPPATTATSLLPSAEEPTAPQFNFGAALSTQVTPESEEIDNFLLPTSSLPKLEATQFRPCPPEARKTGAAPSQRPGGKSRVCRRSTSQLAAKSVEW